MKNYGNRVYVTACIIALGLSAGTFVSANAAPAIMNAAPAQPVDLTYAAEKAVPAVVHIKYVQNSKVQTVDAGEGDPFDFFDPFGFFGNPNQNNGGSQKRQMQTPKREATGSGVIISEDGYIVTNNHVVNGADELTVTLNDNREFSARIVGTDPNTDLALIKINAKNLPTLPVGDSDNLKVGEWVLAVGNPYNLSSTVTAGIVSAKARSIGGGGGEGPSISSFIQTDAAINPGNSGGALVNTRGELVGINAMLYSQTGSYSGYGFAIPTTIMNKVISDLKQYGTVQRAVLGIQGGDVLNYINSQKDDHKDVDLGTNEGVYVADVVEGSSAAAAGITKGDVIINADGKKITKMSELQELLSKKRPGDEINIVYLHNKNKKSKTIELKNAQGNTKVVKTADLDVLGASFRPISEQQKKDLDISFGLEVTKVSKGSIKDGGIGEGFIMQYANDTPLKSISDLQDLVKSASTSKDPVLIIKGVWPTGKRDYKVVKLSE
ncbi:trypsin-like peptidase domain-containing protein [Segatella paludivivens]|uniref:trypsin-like peptidase domain-containing protein n=1 Tax=Segatella paludivivens TaxID=185294 RepID=UPI0003733876|nr:trypsin-like peptidase domain-containing protein [Segatella paludivivens]